MRKTKENIQGITLIALVVTIVVLLILAAVSISLLTGENGVVTQAQDAKEETEIGEEKEKVELAATAAKGKTNWGEITEENLAEELTNNIGERDVDYTLSKEGESFLVTYTYSNRSYIVDANGNIIEPVKREGLKVGDYVDYKPTPNAEGYTADKLTEAITGSSSNSTITQDQSYTTETGTGMTWQILRIYADGSIDLIGSTTSQSVYFQGATGYNNGVTVMNDICEELYSNESLNAKARNIRDEDFEYWMTEKGLEKLLSQGLGDVPYGHTQTYTVNKYYPSLYAQEKGSKIDSGLSGLTAGMDKEKGNTTGLERSQGGIAMGSQEAVTSLTTTQTGWNNGSGFLTEEFFGDGMFALGDELSYWVASRTVHCSEYYATFSLNHVYYKSYGNMGLFTSHGRDQSYANEPGDHLRPVIQLPPDVEIRFSEGPNNINNMHRIQYK